MNARPKRVMDFTDEEIEEAVNKASPPWGTVSTDGVVYAKSVAKVLAADPSSWTFRRQLSAYCRSRKLRLDFEGETPPNCLPPPPGWNPF